MGFGTGMGFTGGGGGGGGTVTNVTASAPLQSSGGATPNISFVPQADGSYVVNFSAGVASLQVLNVLGTLLTGFLANNAVIVGTDNILQAFGKAQGQINALIASIATYIAQNGNSFGTTLTIGTNDNNAVAIETNGTQKWIISPLGTIQHTYSDSTGNIAGLQIHNTAGVNGVAILRFLSSNASPNPFIHQLGVQAGQFTFSDISNLRAIANLGAIAGQAFITIGANALASAVLNLAGQTYSPQLGTNASRKFYVVEGSVVRLNISPTNVISTETLNYNTLITPSATAGQIPDTLWVQNNYNRKLFGQGASPATPVSSLLANDLLLLYVLPANTPNAGAQMSIDLSGFASRGGGNLIFEVWFGLTLIAYTNALNVGNVVNAGFWGDVKIRFNAVGIAGAVTCFGLFSANGVETEAINAQTTGVPSVADTVINTTIGQQFRVTARWTASNASNTLTTKQASIYLQNT